MTDDMQWLIGMAVMLSLESIFVGRSGGLSAKFTAMLTDATTQDTVLASIDWTEWGFADEQEVRLILRYQSNADPPQLVIGPNTDKGRDQLAQLVQAHGKSVKPTREDELTWVF